MAFVLGCTVLKDTVGSYWEIGKERGMSEEYLSSLQKWTREQTAYSQFETRFHISATYMSDAFHRAFLNEQARSLHLTEEERGKREEIKRQAASDFTEFFFYAYTAERAANDFSHGTSAWRIFLLDEKGKQIKPLEIRRVEREKVTPMIESFFPYVQKFYGYCYRLKFPRQSHHPLRLVFTGHVGKIELHWNQAGSI
jgi:hypothetical protein